MSSLDYPTCKNTYATLRIFVDEARPRLLSSEGKVDSTDAEKHVAFLLAELDRDPTLRELLATHRGDVSCYWSSANGHGGPTLSPLIMARLALYELSIWFDFYDASSAT